MSEDGGVRELKPIASDDVAAVLREALALAEAGKLRGVVLFMSHMGTSQLRHVQGGYMNLAEVSIVIDHWKWQHFQAESGGR